MYLCRLATLTGAGHRGGIIFRAEVVFLAAAVDRALLVRVAVRRTLGALDVPGGGLIKAGPAGCGDNNRREDKLGCCETLANRTIHYPITMLPLLMERIISHDHMHRRTQWKDI